MSDAFIAPRGIARLSSDWPKGTIASNTPTPRAGALVRVGLPGSPDLASTGMDGYGFRRKVVELELEANPALTWRDFDTLFAFYFRGGAQLPNLQPVETLEGCRAIASWGGAGAWPSLATVKLPGDGSAWGTWARVFLSHTQAGKPDGRGILIAYQRAGVVHERGPIWRFALCDHSVVTGPGARPNHGWHPASCTRCGIDLSVDSSD